MSYDLDFISFEPIKKIQKALEEIDFFYNKQKYFIRNNCQFFLEFLNPPIAIGNQPVLKFNTLKSSFGKIKLLTPTDIVKDRLAAYIHWGG